MSLWKKLLGRAHDLPPTPQPAVEINRANDQAAESLINAGTPSLPRLGRPVFQEVEELGLYGIVENSPDCSHTIVVGNLLNQEETEGPRDGAYAVLAQGKLKHSGRAERPHQGKVSNNGAFVFNDALHEGGLKSQFLGFRPDGSAVIRYHFEAIVGENAISPDGAFAACQTYNAPRSADACIVALFDLTTGELLARIHPEYSTASSITIDSVLKELCLHTADGDTERYDFAGQMVDHEGWTRRRMARGDLFVIARVVKEANFSTEQLAEIEAGLTVAQGCGETWSRARAFRLLGEMKEATSERAAALAAFEDALLLDPQVGVARKAEKLRRELFSTPAAAAKKSRLEKQAERLSIGHETIVLETSGPKQWRFQNAAPFTTIEAAALEHYQADGWRGAAAEGGLILTLIKAASFPILAERNADTFIEALYAQNVAFEEDRFATATLVQNIRNSTLTQLETNWRLISRTAGETPAFYPAVRWWQVAALYDVLGPDRLAEIAEVFATAAYDFRAGWPDLTLWRGGNVRFVEVKSPSDQMHASQARLITGLLNPLGFSVTLAEVLKRTT